MKSPTSRVGIIDEDGIRNGSATKLRRISTAKITGNSEREYSTTVGSATSSPSACISRRWRAKNRRSSSQIRPVRAASTVRIRARSIFTLGYLPRLRRSLVVHLQNGKEGLLRDFHPTDLLHALLTFLLLLQQLLLARGVAAVALGQHVLAQGLDGGAGDDLRADRRLDGHVEHLPGNQLLHPLAQLAAAPVGVAAVHDQAEGIDPVAVDQGIDPDEGAGLEALE